MKVYAVPTESEQYIGRQVENSLLMPTVRPEDGQPWVCEAVDADNGIWVVDSGAVAEAARVEEHDGEKLGFKRKTLTFKENWVRARIQETTLDTASKVALGKIFKKIIAFLD